MTAAHTWLRRCSSHARAWQLGLLHDFAALDVSLARLDAAATTHMQHGAMAGGDPLADSLQQQLECAAIEGGTDPLPYTSGRAQRLADAGRDPGLYWVMLAAALVAVLVSVVWPLGAAA